jgi:hypothetical protein
MVFVEWRIGNNPYWQGFIRAAKNEGERASKLHRLYTEKYLYYRNITKRSMLGYILLLGMAQDGIEPPTQGFSVLCSTD